MGLGMGRATGWPAVAVLEQLMADRYDELRAALKHATPGPWESRTGGLDCGLDADCAIHTWERCIAQIPDNPLNQRDAAYIAAANPTTIRALLEERDALRGGADLAIDALMQCTDALLHDGVSVDMEHPRRLAIVAADMARAALAQEQGGSDAKE